MTDAERKTIFVVTSGCYSDYHVVGVFSTEDAAKACAAHMGEDGSVLEMALDSGSQEFLVGLSVWSCSWASGNNAEWRSYETAKVEPPADRASIDKQGNLFANIFCWARNQEHAEKIAAERLVQMIADKRVEVSGQDGSAKA